MADNPERSAAPQGERAGASPGDPASTSAGAPLARALPPRSVIERIGLFGIALVFAVLFGGFTIASWFGGEPFLALLGALG